MYDGKANRGKKKKQDGGREDAQWDKNGTPLATKEHSYSRLYPSVIATTFQAPFFIWVILKQKGIKRKIHATLFQVTIFNE